MKISPRAFIRSAVVLLAIQVVTCGLGAQTRSILPAQFDEQLVILQLALDHQDTLLMYTDTGGFNYLYHSGKKKTGVQRVRKEQLWQRIDFNAILESNAVPGSTDQSMLYYPERDSPYDGMLGRSWFAGKTWTIDYTRQQFYAHTPMNSDHLLGQTPLSFPSLSKVNAERAVPRIEVQIDGDTVSLILDTGAQLQLSEELQKTLDKPFRIAGSFINRSRFEQWREDHPEWTVYPKGDTSYGKGADLILVPELVIASVTVGPILFAVREDVNFEIMSDLFTDEPVEGALGGNALSLLGSVTIDYVRPGLQVNSPNKKSSAP